MILNCERGVFRSLSALRLAHQLSIFAAEHRLLLYRAIRLGAEHISSFDFLVAISTDKPDPEQGFTFRIPLAPVGQPNVLALRTPSIGMGIPRIIPKEKPLARSVQQVITNVRLSPITVSFAVDGFALVSSRFPYGLHKMQRSVTATKAWRLPLSHPTIRHRFPPD
jgi:hypothetical protein